MTPTRMRWAVVCPDDTIVGRDDTRWAVDRITRYGVHAHHGERRFNRAIKPGEAATILMPPEEIEALTLLRAELGAVIVARSIG